MIFTLPILLLVQFIDMKPLQLTLAPQHQALMARAPSQQAAISMSPGDLMRKPT